MVVVFNQTIDGTPYDLSSTVRFRAVIVENRDADLTIRSLRVAAGAGNNLILQPGSAVGAGPSAGGQVQITGGTAIGAAAGGNLVLTGGAGTATGTAGSVQIIPGVPNGGTRGGITIGNANTGAITIGDGGASGTLAIVTGGAVSVSSGGGTNISIAAGSSLIFSNANGATQVIPNADKALSVGSSTNRWLRYEPMADSMFIEDFVGSSNWANFPLWTATAVNGGVAPTLNGPTGVFNGQVNLITNAAAANTGSAVQLSFQNYNRAQSPVVEFKIRPVAAGDIAAVRVYIGFRNTYALGGGGGIALVAGDIAAFACFDTSVPDANWTLRAANGAALATPVVSDTAPVGGTWQRIRINLQTTGLARLYINGTLKATLADAAIGAGSNFEVIVMVVTLDAAAKSWMVDRVAIMANEL